MQRHQRTTRSSTGKAKTYAAEFQSPISTQPKMVELRGALVDWQNVGLEEGVHAQAEAEKTAPQTRVSNWDPCPKSSPVPRTNANTQPSRQPRRPPASPFAGGTSWAVPRAAEGACLRQGRGWPGRSFRFQSSVERDSARCRLGGGLIGKCRGRFRNRHAKCPNGGMRGRRPPRIMAENRSL